MAVLLLRIGLVADEITIPAQGGPLSGRKLPWRRNFIVVEHGNGVDVSHHLYVGDRTLARPSKFVWLGMVTCIRAFTETTVEPSDRLSRFAFVGPG